MKNNMGWDFKSLLSLLQLYLHSNKHPIQVAKEKDRTLRFLSHFSFWFLNG